jgi:hypothetical protein
MLRQKRVPESPNQNSFPLTNRFNQIYTKQILSPSLLSSGTSFFVAPLNVTHDAGMKRQTLRAHHTVMSKIDNLLNTHKAHLTGLDED